MYRMSLGRSPRRMDVLQVFGGDVNLMHVVCSGQMSLVLLLILKSCWYFRKEMLLHMVKKWGSKEARQRAMKVYGAEAADLFPPSWDKESWSWVRAAAARHGGLVTWWIGKPGLLVSIREMPLLNGKVDFLVCPGTHTKIGDSDIPNLIQSHPWDTDSHKPSS